MVGLQQAVTWLWLFGAVLCGVVLGLIIGYVIIIVVFSRNQW